MMHATPCIVVVVLAGCVARPAMTDEPPDSNHNGGSDPAPDSGTEPCGAACPPLRLAPNGRVLPVEHVLLTVRLRDDGNEAVFDVQWTYDDPAIADDGEEVVGELRLPRAELDAIDEPVVYPLADKSPLRLTGWRHRIHGIAEVETPLDPTAGTLSLRRETRTLACGISLAFEPTNGPAPTQASGTHSVAPPP